MIIKIMNPILQKSYTEGRNKRHLFLQLSEAPDHRWIEYFDQAFAENLNTYKGHAQIWPNNPDVIELVFSYHITQQVVVCVKDAVGRANTKYQENLHKQQLDAERETKEKEIQEQERKKNEDEFRRQIGNLKFD